MTDIKLSRVKITQLGGFLGKMLDNMIGNLGEKTLLDLVIPFAKDVWPKVATKATLPALDKFERKISGRGAVRAGKVFTLFISNEDIDDIIKLLESLEIPGL